MRFGKQGDMALVSHLDLARLFDRAIRRAAIPISFTGGFHPGPRISFANALSLGVSSSAEIAEFDLTQPIEIETFRQRLSAQLPSNIPIYQIEEVAVGSVSATQLLERAEYWIAVSVVGKDNLPLTQWQDWIEQVLAMPEMVVEHTTKSGKRKQVNLRDRLDELECMESDRFIQSQWQPKLGESSMVLRFVGSCRNDGTMLRPEHLIMMLERISGEEIQLVSVHRHQLFLSSGI
jgi:radical SAM-linked protein